MGADDNYGRKRNRSEYPLVKIPIEDELQEEIKLHLGPDVEGAAFDPDYSNRMIARKFCEFYSRGASKFKFSEAKTDGALIIEMINHCIKLTNNFDELSLGSQNRLNRRIPLQIGFGFKERKIQLVSGEGKSLGEDDIDHSDDFYLSGFHAALDVLQDSLRDISEDMPDGLKKLKVNWHACAVAHLARVVWEKRTGKLAPKSVHADAQGSFGDFLGDILNQLAKLRPRSGEAVSARSALRALENITSKGVVPRGNW